MSDWLTAVGFEAREAQAALARVRRMMIAYCAIMGLDGPQPVRPVPGVVVVAEPVLPSPSLGLLRLGDGTGRPAHAALTARLVGK